MAHVDDCARAAGRVRFALCTVASLAGAAAVALPPLTAIAAEQSAEPAAFAGVRATIGAKGEMSKDHVLVFDLVRSDLHTRMGGMAVPPALTMSGEVRFRALADGRTLVTAELPTVAAEVGPVIDALRRGGLQVSAVHNHHLDAVPADIYIHAEAVGMPATLAPAVRAALDACGDPQRPAGKATPPGVDPGRLAAILGGKAQSEAGVVVVTRDAHPATTVAGEAAPAAMGFEHEFRFAPRPEGGVMAMAEFVLLPGRADPAIDGLRQGGFTVSAVHNHFLTDVPHRLFVHAAATGDAVQLATVLRHVLDATGS